MDFIKNYGNWKYIVEQEATLDTDSKVSTKKKKKSKYSIMWHGNNGNITEVTNAKDNKYFKDIFKHVESWYDSGKVIKGGWTYKSDNNSKTYKIKNISKTELTAELDGKIEGTIKKTKEEGGEETSSKIGVDEYKKPVDPTKVEDDMTLNENCLKEYAIGTGKNAADILKADNIYIYGFEELTKTNDIAKNAWSNKNYKELAAEITSGKLTLHAVSKAKNKNSFLEWKPIDSSGATWKLASREKSPAGKLAMGFSDTFWAQCDWTEKEQQARGTSKSETRVLLGLIKNVKKSQNFKEGDVVYVQMNSSYPYGSKMKGLYLISERKINKKDKEYYSKHFSGSADVRKKDFIMLDTPYTGNSDTKISWGVASVVKFGEKNGGGGYTAASKYQAKYF